MVERSRENGMYRAHAARATGGGWPVPAGGSRGRRAGRRRSR